jgi:hypothetical protein
MLPVRDRPGAGAEPDPGSSGIGASRSAGLAGGMQACLHACSDREWGSDCYFSFSIGFESTPTPSMSISQVSPCFIHTGFGLRA